MKHGTGARLTLRADRMEPLARGATVNRALAINPLPSPLPRTQEDPLLDGFYRPGLPAARIPGAPPPIKPKPAHYKIVCISLYNDDIARLEAMVAELKRRGHTRANKSQLIRAALDQVNLDRIPRGY